MSVVERGLAFDCAGDRLIGVVCLPAVPFETGVVVVVGGPQYRVGSHRLFVRVARQFAQQGFASLRFDCRGMGDSQGELRHFDDISADIGAAIDALLREAPLVKRVVLWGLCDGASAALLYLDDTGHDARVAGLCLLNPWVRSEASLAQTRVKHYYVERLKDPDFWRKLLFGRVSRSTAVEVAVNLRAALRSRARAPATGPSSFQHRMARAWMTFRGQLLLVLSGRDYTAKEFLQACSTDPEWRDALTRPGVQRADFEAADHTLSAGSDGENLGQRCLEWMHSQFVLPAQPPIASHGDRQSEAAHGTS